MKMNKEFFDRYVAMDNPPIFGPYRGKKWKELKKLIVEMGYDPDDYPSYDDDFMVWGMFNEPETTKKIWYEKREGDFDRDLNLFRKDWERMRLEIEAASAA